MVAPESAASRKLLEQGIFANVFNVTGAGPLYREFQSAQHAALSGATKQTHLLDELVSAKERNTPVVTVVDGHPHSMAWIGAALNAPTCPLGVVGFGQSGTVPDLYREYKIDAASICSACIQSLKSSKL